MATEQVGVQFSQYSCSTKMQFRGIVPLAVVHRAFAPPRPYSFVIPATKYELNGTSRGCSNDSGSCERASCAINCRLAGDSRRSG